jgi:hypothetical protein
MLDLWALIPKQSGQLPPANRYKRRYAGTLDGKQIDGASFDL